MTPHVVELLPDFTNGALDPAAAAAVVDHLDTCPDCNAAFAGFQEVLGALALTLAPIRPDPAVRARLLQSVATGRLHRFAGHVSALFALDEAQVRVALDQIDDPDGWEPSPMPRIVQRLVAGAPPGHVMGFLRVPAGVAVPWHEHLGTEHTLVLQGRLVDDEGRTYRPGDEMPKALGSRHAFVAEGAVDLVCGVLLERGYTLLD